MIRLSDIDRVGESEEDTRKKKSLLGKGNAIFFRVVVVVVGREGYTRYMKPATYYRCCDVPC